MCNKMGGFQLAPVSAAFSASGILFGIVLTFTDRMLNIILFYTITDNPPFSYCQNQIN